MTSHQRASTGSKLMIITHEFAPFRGGVATYCQELAAALSRAGAAVEVWVSDYGGGGHQDDLAFPVVRLRAGGSLRLRHLLQFGWQVWRRRAQLETSTVLLGSIGSHMAFLVLVPLGAVRCSRLWSLLHGSEVPLFQRNLLWRFLARRLFARVDRVVTVSHFSKTLIEHGFLAPLSCEITIAPCACSTAAARTVATKDRPTDGKLRILTLARIHPRKGQLDTARALALLSAEVRRGLVYQVGGIGDARYLRQVEQACANGGVAFQYLGEIKPELLAATYQQCDLYAMTSRSLPRSVEGFGITYLEAGFHGKPVVGYRSGGAGEAVVDGETGLLVQEGDLHALAEALQRLITDPALRERLGEAGRRHAERFSWDRTASLVLGETSGKG